jgi:hypothetical protein
MPSLTPEEEAFISVKTWAVFSFLLVSGRGRKGRREGRRRTDRKSFLSTEPEAFADYECPGGHDRCAVGDDRLFDERLSIPPPSTLFSSEKGEEENQRTSS